MVTIPVSQGLYKSAHMTGLVRLVEEVIRCIIILPQLNADVLKTVNQEMCNIHAGMCLVFLECLSVKLVSYIS